MKNSLVVIPKPSASKKWQQPNIDHYYSILSRDDKQTLVSKTYTSSCMLAHSRYMIDRADKLAQSKGSIGHDTMHGGTWYTMEYAKSTNKVIASVNC